VIDGDAVIHEVVLPAPAEQVFAMFTDPRQLIGLVPVRANGQPAVAAYLHHGATGIMVLTVHDNMIGEITGFADPSPFPLFGLPIQAEWPTGQERQPHRR
jgi:hypothetical protein